MIESVRRGDPTNRIASPPVFPLKNKKTIAQLCAMVFYLNAMISLGVQPMILHSFSKVIMVMFFPFFRESNVLLSIPPFKS